MGMREVRQVISDLSFFMISELRVPTRCKMNETGYQLEDSAEFWNGTEGNGND